MKSRIVAILKSHPLIQIAIYALALLIIMDIVILWKNINIHSGFIKLNEIGDTMGGMSAPIIGILSSILIFYSFQQQLKANQLLVELNREDTIRNNSINYISRIENKFEKIDTNNLEETFCKIIDDHNKIIEFEKEHIGYEWDKLSAANRTMILRARAFLEDNHFLIADANSILGSCENYCNYIDKVLKERISKETLTIIEINFSEFTSFYFSKITRLIAFPRKISKEIEAKMKIKRGNIALMQFAKTLERIDNYITDISMHLDSEK